MAHHNDHDADARDLLDAESLLSPTDDSVADAIAEAGLIARWKCKGLEQELAVLESERASIASNGVQEGREAHHVKDEIGLIRARLHGATQLREVLDWWYGKRSGE
jgi:hypothetical protein